MVLHLRKDQHPILKEMYFSQINPIIKSINGPQGENYHFSPIKAGERMGCISTKRDISSLVRTWTMNYGNLTKMRIILSFSVAKKESYSMDLMIYGSDPMEEFI